MWKNVVKGVALLLSTALAICLLALALCYAIAGKAELDEGKLNASCGRITFYDKEGVFLANVGAMGVTAEYGALPPYVKQAFVAVEDKRFYKHCGVDVIRMAGAMLANFKAGTFAEGASTITQQLVKNTHLTPAKTIRRKLKEIKLSIALEKRMQKDAILNLYLGSIYFGKGAYGIEEAARTFFNKHAHELSLSEAAALAGIVRSPYRYSPLANPDACMARRNLVLRLMKEQGYLTEEQRLAASNEPLTAICKSADNLSEYYSEAIAEAADALHLSEQAFVSGRYHVFTYLDGKQNARAGELLQESYYNSNHAAACLIALDNRTSGVSVFASRGIRSLRSYTRQAGSVIKPLAVYAPALERGLITPATPVMDTRTDFGGYSPKNYGDVYHGSVTVRYALEQSLNVPSVRIYSGVGSGYASEFLQGLGLTLCEDSLTAALGATQKGFSLLDLTAAYTAFPTGGTFLPPAFVQKITDASGKTLYEHKPHRTRAMGEDTAFLVCDMLHGVTKTGTAKGLSSLPLYLMAKTGTVGDREGNTDAYCMSFTERHTLLSYMGSTEGKLPCGISGGSYPTFSARAMWKDFYTDNPPQRLSQPSSVVQLSIDREALCAEGRLLLSSSTTPDSATVKEYFSVNNRPKEVSPLFTCPTVRAFRLSVDRYPRLSFIASPYYTYRIYRNGKLIASFNGRSGETVYTDKEAPQGKSIHYRIGPVYTANGIEYEGSHKEGSVSLPYDLSPPKKDEDSTDTPPKEEDSNKNPWWLNT
ncbi:MAG: transglycosylase domain-containing protein [Clostridia bacterium]|nr:transglycosylase domain-containing protein [Clostridia bacterium]